jgi:O-antigen/teichoic acid export membrane protein
MSSKQISPDPSSRLERPKDESFARGYLWSLGATSLPLVSAFLASLIIARWMGPEVVGLVSLAQAVATVFLIVAKFGVDGAASRLASEYQISAPWRIPRLVRLSTSLRLLFTLPTAAVAALLAPQLSRLFGNPALLPLFRLGGLLILAVSLNEYAGLFVLGLKRFRMLFGMRVAMLVIKIGLVLAVSMLAMGASAVMGAYVVAPLVPGLAILVLLFMIAPEKKPDFDGEPISRRLLALSAPLAVSGASVTVYSLLDKIMLGYFSEISQVGLYAMARNIVETSLFPTFALVMALRPSLAAAHTSGDRRRCSDLVYRSVGNSFFFASVVVVVLACLSKPLIVGLYTAEFLPSARLLLLFLPLIIMRSVGAVILPGLIAVEKAGMYAKLTLTGALLNFVLNSLLIPRWGADGAVAATLASYLPIEVFGLREVGRSFGDMWRRGDWIRLVKTVAAGGVIVLLYSRFIPIPERFAATILHAVALAAVYTASMTGLGVISITEVRRQLLSLRGGGREA